MKMNRRQPLPKKSERQKDYDAEFEAIRPVILRRCKGICERCGEAPATHVHHKHRRGQGGTNHPLNLAGLCEDNLATGREGCHDWLHRHIAVAKKTGWITSHG
jgi:hypothetical protein